MSNQPPQGPPPGWPPAAGYGPPPHPQAGAYAPAQGYPAHPMVYAQHTPMLGAVRCPYCFYTGPLSEKSRVTTGGWVLFAILILMVFTIPFCWVGLLITEKQRLCTACRTPIGGAV